MSGEASKFGGNQGEGNREAAKAYNEETQRFVEAGKVEKSAADAKAAVEGEEKAELEEAERAGRARAKEFDPNVKR
ncbi:MAG: hypothetical protein MUD06_01995 [Rhodospirillales bacterium]|jgi:hypothetical protein|nr:hypothetical protein [Rhodospirillales bacterium]